MKRMDAMGIMAAAFWLMTASPVLADSIQLRANAGVSQSTVRLADVATLTGEGVQELAQTIVLTLTETQSSATLTQDSLRKSLAKAGVNWAKTSLKGFENCEIARAASGKADADRKPAAIIEAPTSPILSNPTNEVSADSQDTVRARLTDWMRKLHGGAGDTLRINFADRDARHLDAPGLEDSLVFTSAVSSNLGRVPVTIQRFRGEKLVDSQRLTLEVAQRHLAVVAVKSISKGTTLSFEDVEIREVFLDRLEPDLLTELGDAVGLVAGVTLREGGLVLKDQVRPMVLVQRNELIRVQAIAGGLMVQTFARALDDGGEGQLIQVRNERSRETFTVRVIGVRKGLLLGDDAVDNETETSKKSAENKRKSTESQGTP